MDPTLVSYDDKRPALLPHDHHLSTLIIRDAHESCHSGVAATVAKTLESTGLSKPIALLKLLNIDVQHVEGSKRKLKPS